MRDTNHTGAQDPDVGLMLAFQQGDEESFVMLYRAYRDRIYNFCRRMLSRTDLAEEATQEVFLKLYQQRVRYEPRSRFSTYVFRIAANHCINMRQRRGFRESDSEIVDRQAAPDGASPARALEQRRLREQLQNALASLPGQQAAALLLCHYDGLSYRETADSLRISESAVKSLVHRARERLMEALSTGNGVEGDHAVL